MAVVFDLTPMTRHADAERKIIIEGIETDKRRLWVVLLGAIPGAVVGGALAPLIGVVAVVPIVISAVIAIWLFDSRTRKGLRLRNWDAIKDRRKSKPVFLYAGHVVHPGQATMYRLRSLSAPVKKTATAEWIDQAATGPAKPVPADSWGEPVQAAPAPLAGDGW